MRVASLYRYPVKGLSPERMASFMLKAGAHVPGDRMFAVENGPSGFDPQVPEHQPKTKFLMLMRHEALAALRTRYDDATDVLTIRHEDIVAAEGDLRTPAGRRTIEAFFETYMDGRMNGPARVLEAPAGFRFTDSRSGFVSLINLASVRALEEVLGVPVDPLRFRGNLYVDDVPGWEELTWSGRRLAGPDGLVFEALKRTERCAATNVDPVTAVRDLNLPKTLYKTYSHADCGIYLKVVSGGSLREGDELALSE